MSRWLASVILAATAAACSTGGGDASDAPATDATVEVDYGLDVPESIEGPCALVPGGETGFASRIGCLADFETLASRPLSAVIPGARTSKTLVDRADGDALYFTNAETYPMHYGFAKERLSGHGLPIVGEMSDFNMVEYYSPARRFLLGAVTRYDSPGVWTYEIEPWDTSSAEMVTKGYDLVAAATFFGGELFFHPTSDEVARVVPDLPERVKVITSEQLFAGITYQPLNLGTSVGQVRFLAVAALEDGSAFVSPRDLAVLDDVPLDLSACAGTITAQLQTPLSHLNVLAQNRGTPNMALVGAMDDPRLKALAGKWAKLTVDAFEWTIEEATQAEADAWWEAHKPPPVTVLEPDLDVKDLRDVNEIVFPGDLDAFGGKATNFGQLARIDQDVVPTPKAFAVPIFYSRQFEQQNGFDKDVDAMLADPKFVNDPAEREARLKDLRDRMEAAPVDAAFLAMLKAKLDAEYAGVRMRFRSSTNAEDLAGFTGAGLYDSSTYDPADPARDMATAMRKTWASLWEFRAFEERTWRGIDHKSVGMAVLCHRGFPAEDANGVALTANIFSPEPAFYINVQKGDTPVVLPPKGVTADQFLYFFEYPGHPMVFMGHSSLVGPGETVLTGAQVFALGKALYAIHGDKGFRNAYAKGGGFYAMDVEFKFNTDPGEIVSKLWVKQARPHEGWAAK